MGSTLITFQMYTLYYKYEYVFYILTSKFMLNLILIQKKIFKHS